MNLFIPTGNMILNRCLTIFGLSLWGQDGVDDVVGADSFHVRLQVLLIEPHRSSLLHPGHRQRHQMRRILRLQKQTHQSRMEDPGCSPFCHWSSRITFLLAGITCSLFLIHRESDIFISYYFLLFLFCMLSLFFLALGVFHAAASAVSSMEQK